MLKRKRKRDNVCVWGGGGLSGALEPAGPHDLPPETSSKKRVALSPLMVEVVSGTWREIIRGHRSKYDAKEWTCGCEYVNYPSFHLLFDIPQFKCIKCKEPIHHVVWSTPLHRM